MEEQPLFTCRRARCNAADHDPCPFPEGLDLGLSHDREEESGDLSHDREEESGDLSHDREEESVSEASQTLRTVWLRAGVELHLKALACTQASRVTVAAAAARGASMRNKNPVLLERLLS
jgi:hypothetical protein